MLRDLMESVRPPPKEAWVRVGVATARTGARGPLVLALLGCVACGGAQAGPGVQEDDSAEFRAEAATALSEGDLRGAGAAADQALALDPTDRVAMEVAARVSLALGDPDRVVALLQGTENRVLVRLRARAHAQLGDLEAVAEDLGPFEDREPTDGWAHALLPIARAGTGRAAYAVEGAAEASLPMHDEVIAPIVNVTLDGRTVDALVATSADLLIVDPAIRARPGLVRTLEMGALVMRHVPAITRDLTEMSEQLGTPIQAVLGTDVLLRLHTTLDGPGRTVVLRRAPGPGTGAAGASDPPSQYTSVPFATFEGSFLAVEARLGGGPPTWLTVDSAGPFPIALTDATVETLGRGASPAGGGRSTVSGEAPVLVLDRVTVGNVELRSVPALLGLIPEDLSALAGAPIGGVLGAMVLGQMRVTFDPRSRTLRIE